MTMRQDNWSRDSVVVCEECSGEGTNKHRIYNEFNNVEIEAGQPCSACRGKGRLRQTTSIEYSPL